jgi:hypothetical protein
MNFYRKSTEELITEEELIARYGTNKAIPELGIELASDAFNRLSRKLSTLSNEQKGS